MKKNQILKMFMMAMAAAFVLCGCTIQSGDGPTSVFVAVGGNDDEAGQDGTETDGSEENPSDSQVEDPAREDGAAGGEITPETVKSCEEIYEEIAASVELQSPMIVPEAFVANYGIDFSAIDDYIFAMSEMSTSVETIAIFKSEDADSRENITSSLEMFADGKRAEMENYLPEQFDIVDRSSVKTSGDYVYLVISENAEEIEEIIAACLP
ncbi:MAG: DUF4358 domain-containing protein [Lachnospiraceae bacterium]|nr:DUF4358 domain-containing protein [Lachnospiraceae bacterium]